MRQQHRIPIILDVLKDNDNKRVVLEHLFKPKPGTQMEIGMPFYEIDNIIKAWKLSEDLVKKLWIKNPDLRLTQALINVGVMPNFPGFYYYIEDEQLMIDTGLLEARDILFWGQNYDKDNNRLDETNYILIRDINDGHLQAILDDVFKDPKTHIHPYYKFLTDELKIRKL